MVAGILIAFGLLLIIVPFFIREARTLAATDLSELRRIREAEAARAQAVREDEAYLELWRQRIGQGIPVLSLIHDRRLNLMEGDVIYTNTRQTIAYYPLREDVQAWCRDSLRGMWNMVPIGKGLPQCAVAFQHDSDRVAFKLRWY